MKKVGHILINVCVKDINNATSAFEKLKDTICSVLNGKG